MFEVLPPRFFALLTGQNRQIYAEAVLLLYEQSQISKFGIQYDVMRDLMQELVESQEAAGISFDIEADAACPEKDEPGVDIFRVKANQILRRLRELSWMDVETRANFSRFIVLPHYSSRILSVLRNLCEARSVEYQRFAFTTYQLLTGDEAQIRPGMVILQAEETSRLFLEELIVLINNMKRHMETVANATSVQEVLTHHFDEYKTKIVDRSYHRLKTSDHVARYRRRILETVQQWLQDRDLFELAVEDSIRSESFTSKEEASSRLQMALYGIEEVYNGLDEVFYQIDSRHNGYLRASFDRARYLSQQGQRMDQRISHVLEWINRAESEGVVWVGQLPPALFQLQRMAQLSSSSIYTARKKRAPLAQEKFVVMDLPDHLKEKIREAGMERLRSSITREKVNLWVLSRLGERTEMNIADLAPASPEEFVYLLYTYLYGYEESTDFKLVRGETERLILAGPYHFHERMVVRVHRRKE